MSNSRSRKKLIAALAGAGAASVAVAPLTLLKNNAVDSARQPPWSLPPIVAHRPGGGQWSSGQDLRRPAALLYVDEECGFCKAELRLWSSIVAADLPDLWIVASPNSETSTAAWVPKRLRHKTVKDADGSIAGALGVSAVPITYWVDTSDTVRLVHLGRTTRQRIIEAAATLRKVSNDPGTTDDDRNQ